jgi:hypothetical protein
MTVGAELMAHGGDGGELPAVTGGRKLMVMDLVASQGKPVWRLVGPSGQVTLLGKPAVAPGMKH